MSLPVSVMGTGVSSGVETDCALAVGASLIEAMVTVPVAMLLLALPGSVAW